MDFKRWKLSTFLFLPQVLFIFLYGFFVDYDASAGDIPSNGTQSTTYYYSLYPMFQDVHVMVFIGFGFLMTFLKRYTYGSVGFNLMLAAFVVQWSILMRGYLDSDDLADRKINLNLASLLNADFAAASILISFGAVLGVLSPIQLIVMAFLETFFYAVNEFVIIETFEISDIGGSLVIHAFGAYFGLAVSLMHWKQELKNHPKEGSAYNTDLFAMVGTLFLWLFWPSFNGAPAAGTLAGQRAVLTTVYSLSAATVVAFACSWTLQKSGKISMVHVQNATLAGGVAVGSVANLKLSAIGAVAVGGVAGALSVLGYVYVTPTLHKRLKLHDTCGVHNLHGMPGLLSGFISVVLTRLTTQTAFTRHEVETIYPGLFEKGEPYNFSHQASMQFAGLATTLGISIAGGLATGLLLKIPLLDPLKSEELFEDDAYWLLPETPHPDQCLALPMEVVEEYTSNGSSTKNEARGTSEAAQESGEKL